MVSKKPMNGDDDALATVRENHSPFRYRGSQQGWRIGSMIRLVAQFEQARPKRQTPFGPAVDDDHCRGSHE
jgi:hypothetical protein